MLRVTQFVALSLLLLFQLMFTLLFIIISSFWGQILDPLLISVCHFWELCLFKAPVFDYEKQWSVPQIINFW